MKTKLKKWGALLCAVLALSITFTSIPVYAESVGSLEKTLDLVLVKLGVVCNENGLNTIANNLYDTAIGNVQDFDEYCTSNGLSTSDSSAYDSWKETREYQDHLLDMVMENKYRIATENGGDVTLDFTKDDMNNAIHGGDGVRRGEEYTIDADTVDQVHNVFQDWWSENSEYIILQTLPFSYLDNTSIWQYAEAYKEYCDFYKNNITDNTIYAMYPSGSNNYNKLFAISIYDIRDLYLYTSKTPNENGEYVYADIYAYTSNWASTTIPWTSTMLYGEEDTDSMNDFDPSVSFDSTAKYIPRVNIPVVPNSSLTYFYSKNPMTVKIYKSIDAIKTYSCNKQIVYFSPSYTTNTVTTVSYTGDYYCDNSSVYSYSVVQDDVNNIQGDLTDSIVDSTVDQSVTNITNNYYYTSGSGGGTTDGDTTTDSDNPFDGILEKLMDAVGNIVGLLDDVVALLLSFIADALNAVVSMVTSVINMLTEFKEELSGLTGALSEFFPYLPEDFWTIIMGTVSVICGLAIISYFKNK